jgi:hypothetical protein
MISKYELIKEKVKNKKCMEATFCGVKDGTLDQIIVKLTFSYYIKHRPDVLKYSNALRI